MKTVPSKEVYVFPWTRVATTPKGSSEIVGEQAYTTVKGAYSETPERVKGSKSFSMTRGETGALT